MNKKNQTVIPSGKSEIKKFLLTMKIALIILLFSVLQVSANVFSQTAVNLDVQHKSIREVLKSIEHQSKIRFFYSDDLLVMNKPVDIKAENENVISVLDDIFTDSPLTYKTYENDLIVIVPKEMFQQQTVTGTIIDKQTGEAMAGVNIQVKGSALGAISDAGGKFSLSVADKNATLIFSFVGYIVQEVALEGRSSLQISLETEMLGLDEVVVVGYGVQRKVNLTGAVDVVTGDNLASRPAAQTSQLLQGQAPSMLITMTDRGSEPGAKQSLQIRGVGSLSGNTSPLVLVDGVEMDMNLVDPATIENVTILKDASSSAVYGSRAAFGVILITTKQGKMNQAMRVTYSNITSLKEPTYVLQMEDSYTYAIALNQGRINAGLTPIMPDEMVQRIKGYIDGTYTTEYNPADPPYNQWRGRWMANANYNWSDMFYSSSWEQKHNINIEGGTENTQYYTSVGYQNQPGMYTWGNDKYQRFNALGNVKTKVTDWVTFDFNAKYAKALRDYPNGGTWGDRSGYWMHYIILFPNTHRFNMDGSLANPIEVAMRNGGRIKTDNNTAQFALGTELEPVKGWKTNIKYNYMLSSGVSTNDTYPVDVMCANGNISNIGTANTSISETLQMGHYQVFTAYSRFERSLGKNNFSIMAGYEQDYFHNRKLTAKGYDLITKEVRALSVALGTKEVDDLIYHWATQGVFGRLNYNFDEKYLLEFSARYDGSSRFEKGHRWGFFPSASVGYNISKEAFWDPIKPYVQRLKLRASYGTLGNQNLVKAAERQNVSQAWIDVENPNAESYLYLNEVAVSPLLPRIIDGVRPNYATMPGLKPENLTWETILTSNAGLEAGFLDDRLSMEFDIYSRITKDMMGPSIQLPSVLGTGAPASNNARLKTTGFELTLGWNARINNDITYNVRLGIGDYQTTILEYVNETGSLSSWYVGRKVGDLWGLTTDRIIQEAGEDMPDQSYYFAKWGPGDVVYKDLNGDGKITPGLNTLDDHGDLSVIANSSPRYQISFNGGITWKSFDFSMFWQGIARRTFFPNAGAECWWGTTTSYANTFYAQDSYALDYWRPADETNFLGPNTDAFLPKPYTSTERNKNLQTQTRYLENASYFRLKNLQIGYTLPQRIAARTPMHNLRVFFTGENLLTLSPLPKAFEPESIIASDSNFRIYPLARMYSLGLNITF
jgi:TonB-linked SusC/RagA family outer membrane protein